MKSTLFDSHSSPMRAVPIALAIVALGGGNTYFSNRNYPVDAFCGSEINGLVVGRSLRHTPSMFACRSSDRHEWISYLEEEFNRSGGNEGDSNKDNLRPEPKPRIFQTPVKTLTSAMDLLDQIDQAEPNDLTAVLFFAHYCKTCQRAFVPYKQLANSHKETAKFIRFETSVLTPKQFFSLGIDRVPFLQIYRNGICVSSFSATQKISKTSSKIVLRSRFLEELDTCQRRSLTDWLTFRDQHDRKIEANKAARAKIREVQDANAIYCDEDEDDKQEKLYRSVRTLTSESDLLRLIKGNRGRDESVIVAIMFHSHFDPSCLRAQHKFRKIAIERQENKRLKTKSSCTMARIEASILPDKTIKLLGIQKYPHMQIYWNSSDEEISTQKTKQCVASFSIPRTFLFAKLLHESLDAIDQRTPEEWAAFYNQHKKEIEFQQLSLEGIIRDREQEQ